jgi:hypothetical protein
MRVEAIVTEFDVLCRVVIGEPEEKYRICRSWWSGSLLTFERGTSGIEV